MLEALIAILGAMEPMACSADIEYVGRLWDPPASYPATLRDVASRLPPGTDAKDADLITYAHEGTHFLCRGREGYHGVYVGDGIRIFIPTPPVLTERVFASVPADKRGSIYMTYLNQGRTEYWSAQPLMILDEWNAYIMGCKTRRELSQKSRGETVTHCVTMAHYAAALYRLAKDCPGYPAKELKSFLHYQIERCREHIPDWDSLCDAKFD